MKRGSGTLLLAVVMGSAYLTSGGHTPSEQAAPATRSSAAVADKNVQGEKRALQGCNAAGDPASANKPNDALNRLAEKYFELNSEEKQPGEAQTKANFPVHSVIAIVPDPNHTQLGMFFDRSIDAISWGAQQARYIFARSEIPWSNSKPKAYADYESYEEEGEDADCKARLPGLMIFRKVPGGAGFDDLPLFVYVVGETPTGGINAQQFHGAVERIQQGGNVVPAADPSGELKIIGPTFSGSLYSLKDMLSRLLQSQPGDSKLRQVLHADVFSGTVSSGDTVENTFLTPAGEARLPAVQFIPFQQPDSYATPLLIHYLCTQGYASNRMALLTEDESAYGSTRPGVSYNCFADARPEEDILTFSFPREISKLRTAYQNAENGGDSSTSQKTAAGRTTLPLNLEETGRDSDTVSEMGGSSTVLSQEAVLQGIVIALREHRVQFIILKATDTMDQIFLAKYLWKAYPDARLITLPADLLFPRNFEDTRFTGLLSVSTYSLQPEAMHFIYMPAQNPLSGTVHRVFPDAYSAGVMNATLAMVAGYDTSSRQTPDYEKTCKRAFTECASTRMCKDADLPEANYAQYGWSSLGGPLPPGRCPLYPSLWLTMQGNTEYWPVTALDSNLEALQDDNQKPTSSHLHSIKATLARVTFYLAIPSSWIFLCLFTLFLSLGFSRVMRSGDIFSSVQAEACFAVIDEPVKVSILRGVSAVLLTIQFLLVWPVLFFHSAISNWWNIAIPITAILLAAAFVADALRTMQRRRSQQRALEPPSRKAPDWRAPNTYVAYFGAGFGLLCVATVIYVSCSSARAFVYRYLNVASGVSPALPLLFLLCGLLWWGWHSFAGMASLDRHRPKLLEAGMADEGLRPLTEMGNEKLIELLKPGSYNPRVQRYSAIILGMIALLAATYGGILHPFQSVESPVYDVGYAILALAVAFALFCTIFRLIWVWRECSRMLYFLNLKPLRRAFVGLKGYSWGILRMGGVDFEDIFRFMSREIETIDQLNSALAEREDPQTAFHAEMQAADGSAQMNISAAWKPKQGSAVDSAKEVFLKEIRDTVARVADFRLGIVTLKKTG
jgi:hypothetical protein